MQPYQPRAIAFVELRSVRDWQLKIYSVRYGQSPLDWGRFKTGLAVAEAALPTPAVTPARPGVGFMILHQGRTGNYVVLAWWDQENELPLRVFVQRSASEAWRPARDSESICVWDLEVIAHERNAYVASVLSPTGADLPAYLRNQFSPTPIPTLTESAGKPSLGSIP